MARINLAPVTQWITPAAVLQGDDLAAHVAQRLAISRRSAGHVLRKLVQLQWLVAERRGRTQVHRPGALRQVVQHYPLSGLQEDLPWRRDFAPFFELPTEVRRMTQHAFTELLNNAVDHSGGSTVTVSLRQTPLQMQLLVSDDGCGLFDRIAQTFGISDPHLAMLELSKGKFTSDPGRHSGQGLYFTSRLADVLYMHANHSAFQRRAWERQPWHTGRPVSRSGTSVYVAISLDTTRTLDGVLRAHSLRPDSYQFDRTDVPLHLLAAGGASMVSPSGSALASRAEARRVSARLDGFRRADIDFAGISDIGHGFADELFRVYSRAHPDLELVPVGMNDPVAAMVAAVLSAPG